LSSRLSQGDFAGFHATATTAVRRIGAHVLVLDPASQQILNTRLPYGTQLPMASDLQSAQTVRTSKGPVVSDLFLGNVAKRPIFDVLVPLTTGKLVDHILIMTLDADHLRKFTNVPKLPPGWVIGITDREGRIMARSAEHDAFVGKLLPQLLLEASRQSLTDGMAFSTLNVQGVRTLRAVAKSKQSGWLASANVPLSMVEAEIRRAQMYLTLAALGLLALAAALATFFSRLIVGPINALAASAVTLEADAVPPPLTCSIAEANHVAAALRAASLELKDQAVAHERAPPRSGATHRKACLCGLRPDARQNRGLGLL
jgi:two-component system, sensor histidine kinase